VSATDSDFGAPLPREYAHLPEWQALAAMGIDTTLIAAALQMTVEERLRELEAQDAVFCALHGVALRG
jgi:hypothetical protein